MEFIWQYKMRVRNYDITDKEMIHEKMSYKCKKAFYACLCFLQN